MKHDNAHFLQLNRDLFQEPYRSRLSNGAKWLYVVLNELEQRFCTEDKDYFFRSNEDLAHDACMSLPTLKTAKKELLEYPELVESWQAHWADPETGRRSKKHVTAYRIK